MRFHDRSDAGRRLASRLEPFRGEDVVVLGLPRGGVPVAAEVASTLDAPLDIIVVRKLGVPTQPELGMGAIGEAGTRVLNPEVMRYAHVGAGDIAEVERRERVELDRRAQRFRGDAPREPLAGRTVVIIDDGIATGSTARAACQVARAEGATRVVLAAPIAPPSAGATLAGDADEVICLETPERFLAIGEWYEDFAQTSDEEVIALLRAARARHAVRARDPDVAAPHPGEAPVAERDAQASQAAATGAAGTETGESEVAGTGVAESRGGGLVELVAMMPFAAAAGVVLDAAGPDEVRGRLAWAPDRCTTGGLLHGGALMTLADSLGGICAYLNLPPGARTATVSSATVFTRAVRDGEVTAVARPLHRGRTVIVVQTDVTDADGRRVAQVTQTQAVLGG